MLAIDGSNAIFLICSERSGSNLIRVMMDSHRSVVAPPPLHICRDIGLNLHAMSQLGRSSEAWPALRRWMENRLNRWHDDNLGTRVVTQLDEIEHLSMEQIIRTVYGNILLESGKDLIFIKENNIARSMFLILHIFPRAKFVFQVRDARDYMVSARERRSNSLGNKFGSTKRALELWREDQMCGLNTLSLLGRERVFLQRYEDLIQDPERVLRSLTAFADIEFDPEMLEYHQNERSQKASKKGAQWQNLSKKVMSNNFKKYKERLPRPLIRTMEAYIGNLLLRFGYELEFNSAPPRFWRDIAFTEIKEPLEKRANKELLPFYSDGDGGFANRVERLAKPIPMSYESRPE